MNRRLCKDYTGQRIKHLEMIAGVISHYRDCSARMKNLAALIVWSVFLGLLVGGGTIFATLVVNSSEPLAFIKIKKILIEQITEPNESIMLHWSVVLFISFIFSASTAVCFYQDLMYAQKAKFYTEFYDRIRAQPFTRKPGFCMHLPSCITKRRNFLVALRPTTVAFYISLILYPYAVILFVITWVAFLVRSG